MPGSNTLNRQQQYEVVRLLPGSEEVELVSTASDHAPELHDEAYHPFAERDEWVAELDGSVRILRARDYSVDLVRDQRVVRSAPPMPFEPEVITEGESEDYRLARALNQPSVNFGGAGAAAGGASPGNVKQMRSAYPDGLFPRHKPPFIEEGTFRSPAAHLWVTRSSKGTRPTRVRVDVIDETGRRIREIDLPEGRWSVGLDRGGIYLVLEQEDGSQWLERYAWPDGLG